MAYLNYFLQFKAFADKNPSNSPSLSNMNWVRDVQGVVVTNQSSQYLTIPASGVVTVFTSAAKKFLYLETSANVSATINGTAPLTVSPLTIGTVVSPGSLMLTSTVASLVLTNPSSTVAITIFVACAE